ncbi:O-methyltransferase [Candidatus Woesearchaeota archaeon]|nr:O-methyltransferase [Candidatus Woesearchaeota archaeon]
MNQSTKRLLNELEHFGRSHSGYYNISADTGEFFYMLVLIAKSKNILEVGTSNGYSTIWLGEAAKQSKGKVVTIEINEHKVKMAAENFKRAKLDKTIKIVHGDALKEIPKLKGKFDFLFLDAIKEDYINYLKRAYPKLTKNAIIVADNAIMFEKYMRDYLHYVRNHKNLRSVLVPIGSGVEFSLKVK